MTFDEPPGQSDSWLLGPVGPHSDSQPCRLLPWFSHIAEALQSEPLRDCLQEPLFIPEALGHAHDYMGVLYVITQPGFLWPEGVLPGTQPEQVNPSSSPWVAPELGKSYRKQWNLAQSCWQPRCEQFGGVQAAMREKKANTEREAESKGVERVQTLVSTWLANFNSSRCQLHPSPSCSLDVSFLSFHEPNNSLFAKASWS